MLLFLQLVLLPPGSGTGDCCCEECHVRRGYIGDTIDYDIVAQQYTSALLHSAFFMKLRRIP